MTAVDVIFFVLSACAVLSGWRVFCVDSMIRATFLLLLSFISVGGIVLLLSAPYIGVAIVFMMAVEMMVMGLFMVMFMMNSAGLNPMQMVHQHRFSIASGVVAFLAMTVAVLLSDLPYNPVAPDRLEVHDLGIELLNDSILIFETAGVTLLATMLGAVILSSRTGRFGIADEGAQPPGLDPGGAPAMGTMATTRVTTMHMMAIAVMRTIAVTVTTKAIKVMKTTKHIGKRIKKHEPRSRPYRRRSALRHRPFRRLVAAILRHADDGAGVDAERVSSGCDGILVDCAGRRP